MKSFSTKRENKALLNMSKPLKRLAVTISAAGLLSAGVAVQAAGQGGMDIKIRAQNRSSEDTPSFCPGIGCIRDFLHC